MHSFFAPDRQLGFLDPVRAVVVRAKHATAKTAAIRARFRWVRRVAR
jgi:hypothetical protein